MTIRLRLFGKPRVFDGERWHEAPLDKRFALLAYLACAGDWVDRGKLARLFWFDVEDSRARRDLRYLLHRTRALGFAASLQARPANLCWRVASDVLTFRAALAEEAWDAAVALRAGELLEGLTLANSPEFMAWLELERRVLHDSWRGAVLERAAELEQAWKHGQATALARSLVDADELDEDALQVYLRNAFSCGRRSEALDTYQGFSAKLHTELGLEPLPATQDLVKALQRGAAIPAPRTSVLAAHPRGLRNVPAESTSFIGRDLELTEIVTTLSRPACRLLTLVGPGGIGKTRLAIRAATDLAASYRDGAAFVPLASVRDPSLLAAAIAGALSYVLAGHEEPERQILGHLRDQHLLLLVDNLEHLLEGAALLAKLLENCPGLTILATSRERLNLASEWLLRVEGLGLPDSEETSSLDSYDAVRLFSRRARRVRSDFLLHEGNRAAVVRICRRVGGAPLGIELAAAWVQLLSCEEIAGELARDLDAVSSPLRDVPERQRSLRQVFEHSWRLLSHEEDCTAFTHLSVFEGGFVREAAVEVTGITLRSLLSLLDKSLVKRSADGRFHLHELVKQFAAEKLGGGPAGERAVRACHAAYYLTFVAERGPAVKGGERQQASLREIEWELDNIRSAWRWAANERDLDLLDQSMESLFTFYQIRGRYQEAEDAFRLASDAVADECVTLGRLLSYRAAANWWLNRLDMASVIAERSLTMLTRLGASPAVLAPVYFIRGLSLAALGEFERSKANHEMALDLARRVGNVLVEPRALLWLGLAAERERALEAAERYYGQSVILFRQSGDDWGLTMALGALGRLQEKLGRVEAAQGHYLESLEAARAVDGTLRVAEALIRLGDFSCKRGHNQHAEASYSEALAILRARPDRTFALRAELCLRGLGECARAQGAFLKSLDYFRQALSTSHDLESPRGATRSVVGAAELLIGMGERDTAAMLLVFALAQPAGEEHTRWLPGSAISLLDIDEGTRERAERLYALIAARVPESVVASARARARTLQFSEIIGLLAEFRQRNET